MAGTSVATKAENAVAVPRQQGLMQFLDERRDEIGNMLMEDVPINRFIQSVKNAVLRDPQIADATFTSIYTECQKAAQDGLVLDGREAVLTRYQVDKPGGGGKQTVVVYIPMIAGVKKRVRNSGEIAGWNLAIVYKGEAQGDPPDFRMWRDDLGMHLLHRPWIPAIDGDPGPMIGVYSAVRLRDGSMDYEFMSVEAVNKIRARTRSKKGDVIKGPWATDYEEMAKKTVAKRHAKNLPVSSELRTLLDRDNDSYDMSHEEPDDAPVPTSVGNKRRTSAASKLKAQPQAAPEQENPEPEPGEEDEGGGASEGGDGTPNPDDAF